MFGLIDLLVIKKDLNEPISQNLRNNRYKVIKNPKSNEVWICFLPWHATIEGAMKFAVLPKDKNLIIVQESNNIVSPDPNIARMNLLKIKEKVDRELLKFKNCKINVLTLSVGTYPGIYFANNSKIHKLVCVVPGDRLGACIYTGDRTVRVRDDAIKRGFKSSKDYDKILKGTNAIENISNLPPNKIHIHMSMWDRFIKTREDRILVDEMVKLGKNPKVYKYHLLGHVETLILFGLLNRLKFNLFNY